MCGIVAIVARAGAGVDLAPAIAANSVRGRDSWGFWSKSYDYRSVYGFPKDNLPHLPVHAGEAALANLRAEPTTEYVKDKRTIDVQPYVVNNWAIVHNGTIANDKELIATYSLHSPTRIDSYVIATLLDKLNDFPEVISKLIGSYAICAIDKRKPGVVYFAMNYRPLYLHAGNTLSSVALSEDDRLLPPYSIGTLDSAGLQFRSLFKPLQRDRALVVCSGGLDSTVAAVALQHAGMDIELLHFDYGCRATRQEDRAVKAIAEALKVPLRIVKTPIFTDIIQGSPLTNTERNESFAESEAGAEFAHEWVPARNLIMTSIGVGIAESKGFNVLALGANLEEAGAYADNEPEFLKQFGRLLPFSIRAHTQLRIETPVGNLMKREIVKLGLELHAPLHLTWSCYNNGERHCNNCGPCFMRRTAFEINGTQDPVFECSSPPKLTATA